MPTAEAQSPDAVTVRYRLTPALARRALWVAGREWLPVLIGLALLALVCATWSPLGQAGRVASIVAPLLIVVLVFSALNRTKRYAERYRGREIAVSFDPAGLRVDTGETRTDLRWASLRQIVRGPSIWLLYLKPSGRFFIPADALAPDARVTVAGWASAAGVRLV